MKKIAAIVLIYNGEKFIKPHVEMLLKQVDKVVVVIPNKPFRSYAKLYGFKPDRTKEIASSLSVEVVDYELQDKDDAYDFADAYNFGLSKVRDCDVATIFDTDMLLTDDDFKKFIDLLRENDADFYTLDWSKYSPDYHLDWDLDHGLMDQVESLPMAISTKCEVQPFFKQKGKSISIEGIMFHHFRNWKSDKMPKGDFISAPQEIKDKMNKWKEELYA